MDEQLLESDGCYHIGAHCFRFEPPDIMHIIFDGPVNGEQFELFYEKAKELVPDGPFYILRDTRAGGFLSAETRARIIKIADPARITAIVSYGASFQIQIIVTMLLKAMRVFRRSAPLAIFVNTVEEGKTWIEEHRRRASL